MTTGIIHDQNLEKHIEKQMGCMAGFFQLFDRHQILTGKRLYSTKRLTSSPGADSTAVSEESVASLTAAKEQDKPQQAKGIISPSPDRTKASPATAPRSPVLEVATPADIPPTMPLPLPIFEFKEGTRSSWKFSKEAPRLSLDSRAAVDAKGKLYPKELKGNHLRDNSEDEALVEGDEKRRSTSVIARLMGLEPLPDSSPEPVKKAELRRSASESRVSRDLLHYRFIDGNNFQLKQSVHPHSVGTNSSSNVRRDNATMENFAAMNARLTDPMEYSARNMKYETTKSSYRGANASSPWKSAQQRKSFFDSQDFFPEPKQNVSIYGEIEKRLKMRGIDEPSKDLETLKQILEALQLKGLLHSKKPSEQIGQRNFVYERNFSSDESPIVLMKPARSRVSPFNQGFGSDSPPTSFRSRSGVRRNLINGSESFLSVSPRRERPELDRNLRNQPRTRISSPPTRRDCNAKSPNSSPVRRRPLSVETQRKTNDSMDQRRASPVHSPKLSPRRTRSDQTGANRSPRNRRSTADIDSKEKISLVAEDESSSISESTVSTSSQTDTERSKMEECKGGRSLLERCDKLLHSIAEMTAAELQPSPVSVLDSSFYKDESSSPSPIMKRTIDFKGQSGVYEEEIWSPAISPIQSKYEDEDTPEDCDFIYISDILRACDYLPEDADIFLLLEKQQFLKGNDTSKVSRLQRKLIFDTISEILDRDRRLPPWKLILRSNSSIERPSLRHIWSEFQNIREQVSEGEDLFDTICGVLRKDLAGDAINGWEDCHVEMSEAVLDIERLIFKDLVGETVRDLAAFAGDSVVSVPRRKLVF